MDQRIAIGAGVGGALFAGVLGLFLLKTPPRVASPMVATTAVEVQPPAVQALVVGPIDIHETKGSSGPVFQSDWTPLDEYPNKQGEKAEWSLGVVFDLMNPVFVLYVRSTGSGLSEWEDEAKKPAIIIGGGRRSELKCLRDVDRSRGNVSTLVACQGEFRDVILIARAKNTKLVFGAGVYDLGAHGSATARELTFKAGRIQQRSNLQKEADIDANIRRWLGDE